jgi:hypothetical protein
LHPFLFSSSFIQLPFKRFARSALACSILYAAFARFCTLRTQKYKLERGICAVAYALIAPVAKAKKNTWRGLPTKQRHINAMRKHRGGD